MQPELPRNKQSEYQQKSAANLTIAALLLFKLVPRPGVEPGRVAPLVFETSASTDSAIWAHKNLKNYLDLSNMFCILAP